MRIFRRVAALYWRNWPRVIIAYICLLAGAGLAIAIPYLTGRAIDQALSAAQMSAILLTAVAVAGAGLLRSFFGYWQSYLAEFLSQKVAYDLRNTFYDRLQRLSYSFHDQAQTGQLMSRATSDIEAVRTFVGFALLRGVYFMVLMVGIIIVLFAFNWKLALIGLSMLPIITFRTIVINRKLRVLWSKIQQGLGVLVTILQENFTGVRVVRAFAREEYESAKFGKQAETIYNQEMAANNLLAANSPLMSFLLTASMAGILWYGGRQVVAGGLSTGELAQFLIYLVMLGMPVRMLGWLTILFSRAIASGQRIFEVVDRASPVQDRPGAIEVLGCNGEVEFRGVSFGYGPQDRVLKDVSFVAQPGQMVALVGASGSGKSTIANLIPRFYDVTAGRILIDGRDIRDMTVASLRRHVGLVHQDTFLFSATIRENITYGQPGATQAEIEAAARTARLHDFIVGLPEGYETRVGERGITLSGGQKQRLAIARTILLDPKILIMDDSTSSVDAETEYLIQEAMAELPAGRTTFVIAHRLRSVQAADLILVLQDGQVVDGGRHEELIERSPYYRQLYRLQLEPGTPQKGYEPGPAEITIPEGDGHHAAEIALKPRSGTLKSSDDLVFGKPYDSRVVSRLAGYFGSFRVALPMTIAATLVYTGTIVASPYLVGLAEDRYIGTGDIAGLNLIVFLFMGNAILNWAAYYTQIIAEARLGQSVLLKMRKQLFDHLQQLSVRFFDSNEVGRIMSRVQNDVGELGDFLDSGAFWVAGQVVTLVAIIATMFAMNAGLAAMTLSVVPLLLIFLVFWQKRARQSFIRTRQSISRVNAALQENISGVRVIQSLSREDLNLQHFKTINRANFDANLQAARVSAGMMPVVELLVSMAIAVIIVFGGMGVLNQTIMVGALLAFVLYIQNFFDPIRSLTMEYSQLQRAMASGVRIFELLDVAPEVVSSPGAAEAPRLRGEIRFEDVSFSYQPETPVLREVSLFVPAGKTVALVGPTGAGKTTIINLIARFYDVDKGRILVDGYDLHDLDLTSYRRQVGLVLQDPFLFTGTVRENIAYGNPRATDADIEAAARVVGAHDWIAQLPGGYSAPVQERGQNLSMGQRQLISFARALLVDPAILLLDEATASIDSFSEHALQAGLKNLRRGRTTVVIAHRLSTVRDADMIMVVDRGRIAEQGRHDELLARGGIYSRLYRMVYASAGRPVR